MDDAFIDGNNVIEEAIDAFYRDERKETLIAVLEAIRRRMHADGHFIFPVLGEEGNPDTFTFRMVRTEDGEIWYAAFTSWEEWEKGEKSQVISNFIDSSLNTLVGDGTAGIMINPWGKSFMLSNDLIEIILEADGNV